MPPYLLIFFENPSIKVEAHPHDLLPEFKNEAPLPIEKKKQKKSETVINTCVSLIK